MLKTTAVSSKSGPGTPITTAGTPEYAMPLGRPHSISPRLCVAAAALPGPRCGVRGVSGREIAGRADCRVRLLWSHCQFQLARNCHTIIKPTAPRKVRATAANTGGILYAQLSAGNLALKLSVR